jgi:hypothetical protein
MESAEKSMKELLNNPLIFGLVIMFVVMYGPRLSPNLPSPIRSLFDFGLFKFLVMAMVVYLGSYDIRLSLLVAIVFVIIMDVIGQENTKEDYKNQLTEYYANYNLYGIERPATEHFANSKPSKKNENISTGIGYSCDFTVNPETLKKAAQHLGTAMAADETIAKALTGANASLSDNGRVNGKQNKPTGKGSSNINAKLDLKLSAKNKKLSASNTNGRSNSKSSSKSSSKSNSKLSSKLSSKSGSKTSGQKKPNANSKLGAKTGAKANDKPVIDKKLVNKLKLKKKKQILDKNNKEGFSNSNDEEVVFVFVGDDGINYYMNSDLDIVYDDGSLVDLDTAEVTYEGIPVTSELVAALLEEDDEEEEEEEEEDDEEEDEDEEEEDDY